MEGCTHHAWLAFRHLLVDVDVRATGELDLPDRVAAFADNTAHQQVVHRERIAPTHPVVGWHAITHRA